MFFSLLFFINIFFKNNINPPNNIPTVIVEYDFDSPGLYEDTYITPKGDTLLLHFNVSPCDEGEKTDKRKIKKI